MIDSLIQGRIHGQPQQRTGNSGKPFTTAKVRVPTEDGSSVFASVIAFDAQAQQTLLALGDKDAVCIAGSVKLKVWTPRDGGDPQPAVDVVASQVLTVYAIRKKRQQVQGEQQEEPLQPSGQRSQWGGGPAYEFPI